jgi:chromosome condensin MukBEF complex kleisin-like MukF subunit
MYESSKELARDRETLTQLGLDHEHYLGAYTQTHYVVSQLIGDQAVVLSCAQDDSAVVDNATGKIVEPSPHTQNLVNDLLQLINGQWMVTDAGVRSPTC